MRRMPKARERARRSGAISGAAGISRERAGRLARRYAHWKARRALHTHRLAIVPSSSPAGLGQRICEQQRHLVRIALSRARGALQFAKERKRIERTHLIKKNRRLF